VGGLIPLPVRVAVGMVLALTLVAAPLVLPRRVPQLDRETDQNLLSRGPYVWALANGALLGAGFTSRIGYWIWYLVPLGCVIAGSPGLGALIWAGYGFTRLGIAAGLAYRLVHEPDRMADLQQGAIQRKAEVRRLINPATSVLALAVLVWLGI
jgi:hypothetical protein